MIRYFYIFLGHSRFPELYPDWITEHLISYHYGKLLLRPYGISDFQRLR